MAVNDVTSSSSLISDPISGALKAAASATGVDFGFLFQQAKIESGLNTEAKASTSSASGLFQFTRDTWLKVVEQHGSDMGLSDEASALKNGTASATDRQRILEMRSNPEISARLAANYAIDNARALKAQGHSVTGPTDLYLAHFLGSGGAAKFLTAMKENPNAPAASVLPSAANANKTIFYTNGAPTSLNDIYQRFAKHFDASVPASKKSVQVAALALAETAPPERALTVNALVQHLKAPETLAGARQKPLEKGIANGLQPLKTPIKGAAQTTLMSMGPASGGPPSMSQKLLTPKSISPKSISLKSAGTLAPVATATPATPAASTPASDDTAPISVDSLAKFLDSASKWSADPGKMQEQAQKGVASRDASEGIQQRAL